METNSTKNRLCWSKEEAIELIEAYKKIPLLWDVSEKQYYCIRKRNEEWKKLATELNKPFGDVKRKWAALMSSFRFERNKEKDLKEYKSDWYAYEALQFVCTQKKPTKARPQICRFDTRHPQNLKNPRTNNRTVKLDYSEDETIGDHSQGKMDDFEMSDEFEINSQSKLSEVQSDPRKKQIEFVGVSMETGGFSEGEIRDESAVFGNLVKLKLKNYDLYTKSAIQSAIMKIFSDADLNLYSFN